MKKSEDRLRRSLAELPDEIQPDRDLWPGIAARLDDQAPSNGDATPIHAARSWSPLRSRHIPVGWALAASIALASLVGGGVWATMRAPTTVQTADVGAIPADEQTVEPITFASAGLAEYEEAAMDLQSVIDAGRDLLDPATLEVLERSVAVIDNAISEARAALNADPGHEGLRRMLMNNHRRKIDLLRQAASAVQARA